MHILSNKQIQNEKSLICLLTGSVVFSSCTKTDQRATPNENEDVVKAPTQRKCASYEVLDEQLKTNPGLRQRMDEIENFTKRFARDRNLQRLSGDSMIIPVVVNVIYKSAAENISLGQIQSQIDVLNEDYRATNADITRIPSTFSGVAAGDTKVRFVLETVVRKSTTKKSWTTNDAMEKEQPGRH